MGWSIHHKTGLLHHDDSHAFQGYTLIAMSGGDTAYLIDMEGRVCHRWHHEDGLAYGVLLPNGNLLCRSRGAGGTGAPGEPVTGIMELDWDGNVAWEYWDSRAHHDLRTLAEREHARGAVGPDAAGRRRGVCAAGAGTSTHRWRARWSARWMRRARRSASTACGRRSTRRRT